jgi:hypothetical protein
MQCKKVFNLGFKLVELIFSLSSQFTQSKRLQAPFKLPFLTVYQTHLLFKQPSDDYNLLTLSVTILLILLQIPVLSLPQDFLQSPSLFEKWSSHF